MLSGRGTEFGITAAVSRLIALSVCLLIAGCAAARPVRSHSARVVEEPAYSEATASALVFSPPLSPGDLGPDLDRAARAPSAFLGYDEVTEYYYLRMDDRQGNLWWGSDGYQRQAITERTGVRYR